MRRPRMILTKEQDDWLLENYGIVPNREIMKKLNRSYGAIVHRISKLRSERYGSKN